MREKSTAVIVAYARGPSERNILWGTSSLGLYVLCWFLSVFWPFVGFILYNYRYDRVLRLLIVMLIAGYLPWPKYVWLRYFCGEGASRYFSYSSLIFEALPAEKSAKNLLLVHPHGIVSIGWAILYNRPEMKGFNFCFATSLYCAPWLTCLVKMCGANVTVPHPAYKSHFISLMQRNKALALIPGGLEEASITNNNQSRVYLKSRKGFVKYALRYGYALTPCYVFGENETYWNIQGQWKTRFLMNRLGIPAVLAWGRWWCYILPRAKRLHIVVGKPIEMPCIPNPTLMELDTHHKRYCETLVALFDRHKLRCGEGNQELKIW